MCIWPSIQRDWLVTALRLHYTPLSTTKIDRCTQTRMNRIQITAAQCWEWARRTLRRSHIYCHFLLPKVVVSVVVVFVSAVCSLALLLLKTQITWLCEMQTMCSISLAPHSFIHTFLLCFSPIHFECASFDLLILHILLGGFLPFRRRVRRHRVYCCCGWCVDV